MDNHYSEVLYMRKRLPLPTSGNHVNTSMATIDKKTCAANGAFN